MSTGYHLQVGYNSAASKQEVGEKLKAVVTEICAKPEQILEEAKRVEGIVVPPEYAESYCQPWQDLTAKWLDQETPELMQMASGGGIERDYKEAMRRAFCRLVIQEMHRNKYEVNLVVA